MTRDEKLEKLRETIDGYGQMIVALSGGVDSVFLLLFARSMWGDDRVAAMTASAPNFAPDEISYASELCEMLGISHKTVRADFLLDIMKDNPPDRCYGCKKALFSVLKERADMVGSVLADGTNLDDMSDYRPGYRAVQELGVASPLMEAGLTKADIRTALRDLIESDPAIKAAAAFPIWEKPAFACLASRIPYGESITAEKLEAVYRAEAFLKEQGLSQVRVRHHGDVARIEVLPGDREKFFDEDFMDTVNEHIKACGFRFAALDLGGYRMGNMNEQKL